jgi:hypothetical protein
LHLNPQTTNRPGWNFESNNIATPYPTNNYGLVDEFGFGATSIGFHGVQTTKRPSTIFSSSGNDYDSGSHQGTVVLLLFVCFLNEALFQAGSAQCT